MILITFNHWPWRFVSSLAFLFWLSQCHCLLSLKYIFVGDFNHFLLLINLFPPKDDLLPHVTGGFRGRAITVGSLEYDPWMKFVRSVEKLKRGIMTRFSGTARAMWSDIPASSLSCSKRCKLKFIFPISASFLKPRFRQMQNLMISIELPNDSRWASSWTSPMLSESLLTVSGGWWGGASGTAWSGEINKQPTQQTNKQNKGRTLDILHAYIWLFHSFFLSF